MKEEINIYNGKGILHLKGNLSETFLFIKKNPQMVCFHAEIGTVWRYHIGCEIEGNILDENYKYESLVRTGEVNFDLELSKQFNHITELLTNGQYELHLCEFPWEFGCLPAISKSSLSSCYDVYGGGVEVVATQSYLDHKIVEQYKTEIQNGSRPIMVLFRHLDSWTIYLIDGHHKFKAYKELKVNPRALMITKLDHKEIKESEALEIMRQLGLEKDEWIDIFKQERKTKEYESNYHDLYSKGIQSYFK